MNLQIGYDLEAEKDRLGDRLQKEVKELMKPELRSISPHPNLLSFRG